MKEDRGAFKTNQAASRPISAKSDVPSMPWQQCRKPPKKRRFGLPAPSLATRFKNW
jgi:hypothetical protein